MNNYNQPYLEKYSGRASRHKCPKCGAPHSFAYYLDGNTGQPIDKTVGRCNHESGCGYHYTPKQFFIDNPTERERHKEVMVQSLSPRQKKEIGYIPFSYVERSVSYNSSFVHFLCGLFDRYSLESPIIERLMQDYALGATKDGSVIYWQIDTKGRVRTGKVMKYNPETGHRIKDAGGINWVHAIMKKQKLLPDDYNLVQCLFGEHLLRIYPDRVVALVESEKSALIGTGVFPEYVWLATGGKSQLSTDNLKVIVSDLLEKNATEEDRANKIDLADWLIRYLSDGTVTNAINEVSESERILQAMKEANPDLQLLIDTFDLKLVS